MKGLYTFLLWQISIFAFSQGVNSPLWCDLVPGQYDAGLKVHYLLDTTKSMVSTDSLPHALKGKPIRVKLYYPGIKTVSSYQLAFLDQINIFPDNHQFATYNAILNKRDLRLQGQFSPSSDSLERVLFSFPTMAFMDIPFAKGKFPLLIYMLGLDDHQMENSVLWEYLASHGYVVAVLPSFGKNLERIDVPYTLEGVQTVYEDAVFVLNSLSTKSYVDSSKIGVIGHSFGGLVNHLLASRHDPIKAVVSLDGSVNMERGQNLLDSLEINWSKNQTPYLNLYVKSPSRNLAFSDKLNGAVYQVGFHKATHFDFQNFGLYAFVTGTEDPRVTRRRSAKEGKDVLIGSIKLTRNFLDYVLRGNTNAEGFITGSSNEAQGLKQIADFNSKK